jgi:type IV pilus assembly protein PilQ
MKHVFIITLVLIIALSTINAQDNYMHEVRIKLDKLVEFDPAYRNEIDLAVGSMPIGDLLRNVAKISQVNVSYKGDNSITVNSNFSKVKITDLLYFLCREYNLDLEVVGNIVSVFPYEPPLPDIPGSKVHYQPSTGHISYELHEYPLSDFAKLLADSAGINVVYPVPLAQKRVSGYALRLPLSEAMHALALGNNLLASKTGDKLWAFDPLPAREGEEQGRIWAVRRGISKEQIAIDSVGTITVQVEQASIYDILCTICERLGLNYYFISPVDGSASLYLKDVGLHTLLKVLFTGTPYSYYEEEGILMFGISKEDALLSAKVIPLENRSVENTIEIIPEDLKQTVKISPFGDLNSLIVSGDQLMVARVEQFIKSIDKTVPLITIDVIIVDVTNSRNNEQGISVGYGNNTVANKGSLLPHLEMDLNADGINKIIRSFNGLGAINLGKVGPNFYANLRFLEENGDIELRSTPKLSTLNGHQAELKSGQRQHYKEVYESLMGSQNPIQTSSYQWKFVDANLELTITPHVSGNGEITLSIDLSQTEFTTIDEKSEAPPGTATRSFKSMIRVGNEDMVLLGGIERNDRIKTSSGLPLIARIPLLKWIFGKSTDKKEEHKLNIFIKPTVII